MVNRSDSIFAARRFLFVCVLFVTTAIAGGLLSSTARVTAQTEGRVPNYRRIPSPERVAALVDAASRKLNYIPGEVVVRFRAGVTGAGQQRALTSLRSRPSVNTLRWSGRRAVLLDPGEPDARVVAAELRRQPEIAFAEPNYLYRIHDTPNDPGFASHQWNLRTIDMPRAWDINRGGNSNLIVAVVDSGITTTTETFTMKTWSGTAIQDFIVRFATNPDLSSARLVSPIDLVFWEGPVLDTEGHGTHVSGTIGQDTNNSTAEAGIAYNARIMPVKVCLSFWDLQFLMSDMGMPGSPPLDAGGCPDDAVAAGIEYAADNGAKIINLSLGGEEPAQAILEAIRYAVGKGAFVAIAAGNAYEEGNPVEYPAAYGTSVDGAMTVGSVGPSRTRAYYSGTASGVEIAAPGGSFLENGVNGMIWQFAMAETDYLPELTFFPRFDRYTDTPSQGTSMATPHVAGIAALLTSQGVSRPAAVEALIKATALDLGAKGRDDEYGFGLIQPRVALRGFGLITR
jgi:serine protease